MQRACLVLYEGSVTWCGDVDWRRGGTGGGGRKRGDDVRLGILLGQKKWENFTLSIQLLQMNDKNLKQRWVNLFLKNICKWDLVLLFHHTEHNGENKILNRYYLSEINYFKILLLYKMIWQMILDKCWYVMV
jgi:hypothetical protein